jgi:hypothetical protein
MTYGISTKLLPVDADGIVSLENHREWIKSRIQHEELSVETATTTMPRTIVPALNDVLLGRGKLIQEHTGNRRFRNIVENHRDVYERTSALDKTLVASRIVEILKQSGGRFLKQQYGACWEEVDDDTARDKVGHFFRNKRRTENQKKGKEVSSPAIKAENAARKPVDSMDVDSKKRARF